MDHYLDICVRPDPELVTAHVLNTLAGKLHRALVNLGCEDVGVSFPHFAIEPPSLGNVVRLHSTRERLQEFGRPNWLTGMTDHVIVGEVRPVPVNAKYRVVRRVQTQSSAARLRRRQMKRHGWTEHEASNRISDSVEQRLRLPFFSLRSQSTGQSFRLFIDHQPCQDSPTPGVFNAYGLSVVATIPWF